MTTLTEQLQALLAEKIAEPDFQHLFVTDIQQLPNGIIHIFLDSDTGVTLEHCVAVSRFLEPKLDENGWIGDDYTLEISSSGVGSPLKQLRQYPKNIGREVSVKIKDDIHHIKGILKEVKEDRIVVEYEEKIAVEGKKKSKKKVLLQSEILFDTIEYTTVKISFK